MATYMVTTAPASSDELARAWTRVGQRTQELADAVESVLEFAAPGNVADTGIMAELYALLGSMGINRPTDEDICRALAILMKGAKDTNNVRKKNRIKATQIAKNCRRSRQRRE